VDHKDTAMGTSLHFVGYTNARVGEAGVRAAFTAAVEEMRRLEGVLSEWKDDTELGRVNLQAGEWTSIGGELSEVLDKSLWAGRVSEGTFDISFQVMSDVWKFGTSQDAVPKLPAASEIARRRAFIDYRRIELDRANGRVRLPRGFKLGLGGIAKGYIVDRAAATIRARGVEAFLVQAGGDRAVGERDPGSARRSGQLLRDDRALGPCIQHGR
jgi:thiamine biosynthesis lipoprotein